MSALIINVFLFPVQIEQAGLSLEDPELYNDTNSVIFLIFL